MGNTIHCVTCREREDKFQPSSDASPYADQAACPSNFSLYSAAPSRSAVCHMPECTYQATPEDAIQNGVRRLFSRVHLDREEMQKTKELCNLISSGPKFYAVDVKRYDIGEMLRFLHSAQMNVEKARDLVYRNMQWRSENLPVAESLIESELYTGKAYWYGRDRHGRPCLVLKLARHNTRASTTEQFCALVIYLMEVALAHFLNPGHVETVTVIIDLENVSMMGIPTDAIKSVVSILEQNYPNRCGRIYIVNTPALFSSVWAVLKQVISAEKVSVLGSDFKQKLLQEFDPQLLQVAYGGLSKYVYNYVPPYTIAIGNSAPRVPTV